MNAFTSDTNDSVEETVERLSEVVGEASTEHSETRSDGIDVEPAPENALELVEEAETGVESLLASVNDGTAEEIRNDIEDLRAVIQETSELLETIDLTQASDAIDHGDIDEAIDASEISTAIAEGEAGKAVKYSALLQLIEFEELLDAIDVRELKQNKDEFETAVTEFVDENDGSDWIVFDVLRWLVETTVGGTDGDMGITDSIDDAGDAAGMASGTEGQMKQAAMQSKLLDAVEEFREGILETHDHLAELREQAEHVTETTGDIGQPSSRNPTAYSTMPSHGHPRFETKFSTVPRDTRHSTVSNPPRIYGSRFDTQR